MSMDKMHLRKLLRLFYADRSLRRRLILDDIRSDIKKQLDEKGGGGDFHGPFWADVKDHVAGKADLREQSKNRIGKSKARARLYPLLTNSFLTLWNEKIRFRNEKFDFIPTSLAAQFPLNELDAVVKIENIAAVKIWDGSSRIIYPYFSEAPALPLEGVRLGFWLLAEALPNFRAEDFRMIDILRGAYFRPTDAPMVGNERGLFVQRYDALLTEWKKLWDER